MALRIKIQTGCDTPIYRQIVDQVHLAAATGTAKPGEAVPSIRGLAEQLVVNPNTVAKAYAELRNEGLIESQQGRGMTLCDRREVLTDSERMRRVRPLLSDLAKQAVMLGFNAQELSRMLKDECKALGQRPSKGA